MKEKKKMKIQEKLNSFETLVKIMNILRGPGGCPWDQEQTISSLKKYLLEETYELLEVMEGEKYEKHKEELGDLLLQVIFQSEIRQNEGEFDIYDVIEEINKKYDFELEELKKVQESLEGTKKITNFGEVTLNQLFPEGLPTDINLDEVFSEQDKQEAEDVMEHCKGLKGKRVRTTKK